MKTSKLLMTGATLAFLAGGIGSAFAQAQSTGPTDDNPYNRKKVTHGHAARSNIQNNTYRPLTVSPAGVVAAPVAAGADVAGAGIGLGLGAANTGIGAAGTILGGVGGLVTAPIAGLGGGAVGISPDAASALPIKARYANAGPVADSVEEGWLKPVPVDKSGPVYELDTSNSRSITPFSLFAFPLTGVTSIITSPLRAAAPAAPGA